VLAHDQDLCQARGASGWIEPADFDLSGMCPGCCHSARPESKSTSRSCTFSRGVAGQTGGCLGCVDTPHIHTFEGDSVLSKFVICSPPSRSRRVMTRIIQECFFSTVSVKVRQSRRVRFFAFIHHGTCAHRSLRPYFDSNRKKWTFGSGSWLCQRFTGRREEMAWKWRRIETSLMIVIIMLRVLTYVVSYKLFWDWIGVVRFVSQEVWFGKGFVIWYFFHYCLVQIVMLWSLKIGVRIIFTTNELVHKITILRSNTSQNDEEEYFLWKKMRRRPDFFMKQNAPQERLMKQIVPQANFRLNPGG